MNRRYLSPPIEADRLKSLVARLRSGDATVKHEIINGHLRLASSLSRKYSTNRNAEELESEAFYAVTLAVDNAVDALRDNEITPYIAAYVNWHCRGFLQRAHVIRMPARTLASKQGQIVFLVRQPMTTMIENRLTDESHATKRLTELLDECIQSPVERELVFQRVSGYTDAEIAQNFGWSRSYVQQLRQGIEDRFNRIAETEFRCRSGSGSQEAAVGVA